MFALLGLPAPSAVACVRVVGVDHALSFFVSAAVRTSPFKMHKLSALRQPGAMIQRRKAGSASDAIDVEEARMLAFEKNCQLLNKQQYKGFRRWQVEIWLLLKTIPLPPMLSLCKEACSY